MCLPPPQVMQRFRFSFRFRYDLTFQFQLLCGEFSQYTTLNKQSRACKKIFLLIYVTFVNAYVLRSHPLMQASVSLNKRLAKQQKTGDFKYYAILRKRLLCLQVFV